MDFKRFIKETKIGFIIMNLAVALVLLTAILVGVQTGLKHYTEHGIEVEVPDFRGLYMEEAEIMAQSDGLSVIVIDSTYSTKTPLGTIVEQTPLPGGKVKHGRTIYVIRNARFRKTVAMPELRDMSVRQATTALTSLGLRVGEISYEPSAFRDLVLDIRIGDVPIEAGTRIAEGSRVDLVVGLGKGTGEVTVPDLSGKSLVEARSWLLSMRLTIGIIEYDIAPTETNKSTYVVYQQSPMAGDVVQEGTGINIKLTTDIERVVEEDNEQNEEEFF